MKVTDHERMIQGGAPCSICGSFSPCGDVFSCGWWSSSIPNQPQEDKYPENYERDYLESQCEETNHEHHTIIKVEGELFLTCYCGKRTSNNKTDIENFKRSKL